MIKHRVFISYFHRDDQAYKEQLVRTCDRYLFINGSVDMDDIDDSLLSDEDIRVKIRDNYLKDTTVTIVLLGKNTDRRKHVDWEIYSSLRNDKLNRRSGLLGILLPTHPDYHSNTLLRENTQERFFDNYKKRYAVLIRWDDISLKKLIDKIETAFRNKEISLRNKDAEPDNSAPLRRNNS